MTGEQAIRVLVVDDHPIVRQGLGGLIEIEDGLELVGEAADGVEALDKIRTLQPDVILLDLMMPRMGGLEVIQKVMGENPEARIIVLTSFSEEGKLFPAIKGGAMGYLLKDAPPDMLLQAIRDVSRGQTSLHPTIARKLVKEVKALSRSLPLTQEPLTRREMTVLQLVAKGLTNQEIARQLHLQEGTVRVHVSNILGKLHLANRTQAALYARDEGLI